MNPRWAHYELPPVGMLLPEDIPEVYRLIEDKKQESAIERGKWVSPVRNVCLDLFYHGESPKPPDAKIIPNHIKNNCIRVKDIMLKEPPAVEVKPLDDGGGPLAWYWNGPDEVPMNQPVTDEMGQQVADAAGQPAMQSVRVSPQEFGVPADATIDGQLVAEPFDELTAGALSDLCQQNGWPANWVVGVDSKLLGDIYQKPFDCYWLDCHANEWLDSFASMVVKGGWETGQYQYDDDHHHNLETIPATQVFPDVRHQFVWDMDHFSVTRVYPLGAALRAFPKKADIISLAAKPGMPSTSDSTTFGYKDNRDFKGKIVTLTTTWLADQPAPDWQTEQKAVEMGLAIEKFDVPMVPPEEAMQQIPLEMPEPARSIVDAQTGEPLETNDDGLVWHESWGFRNVLRQIVFLESELIEDDVCPWPRIPIVHAACVGVEDNPYGYGLPWGARHSQKTYSRSTQSIDANTEYYGNAAAWLPAGVHGKMVKEFGRAFIQAGDVLSLEQTDIPPSGKLEPFIKPPEIPESAIEARRENKADLDEIMGMQESLRGEPVTPDASGKLQEESAQQAIGLITAMSKQLQGAIGHLAELMHHSIVHFATVDDIYATCRKVRKPLLAAVHLRHAPAIKWTTPASLSSGAGMRRDRRRLELFELNQKTDPASGEPIVDAESLQEAYNLDPELITQRNERRRQKAQQAVMEQAAVAQEAGLNGKANSNGNGSKNGGASRF